MQNIFSGKKLIYCFYLLSNILLFMVAGFMMFLGIYMIYETKTLDGFIALFFIEGAVLFIIPIMGFASKDSKKKLKLCFWMLFCLLICQIVITILFQTIEERTINNALKKISTEVTLQKLKALLEQNIDFAHHCLFIVIGIQFLCLVITQIQIYLLTEEKINEKYYSIDLSTKMIQKIDAPKYDKKAEEKISKVYRDYERYNKKKLRKTNSTADSSFTKQEFEL